MVSKAWFPFGFFFLLLLVLVFRTNKKSQRAMRCSNGNIHKIPKRATKSHNEQQKAFACFDSVSKTRKSNEEQEKATNGKWKHTPKTKTRNKKQQRAFFILIFIHSHQFWTYGKWLISRAMTGNEKQ